MVRTRNKPLLNSYVQEDTSNNSDLSNCNTAIKSKPKNQASVKRQSSSKKVFNSASKSGSFLGDNVVDTTFMVRDKPLEPIRLGFGITKSLKNSKKTLMPQVNPKKEQEIVKKKDTNK